MTQFPNDEINGKRRAIVHISSAAVESAESEELAARASDLIRNVGAKLDGFVVGRVLQGDDAKTITVITAWKTRDAWAKAIWNERVDTLLEVIERHKKLLDVICYEFSAIGPTGAALDSVTDSEFRLS